MFDDPVSLEKGKTYEIVSIIEGPSSWRVISGKYRDRVGGVAFSFSDSFMSKNGTSENHGQFPAFIFSTL